MVCMGTIDERGNHHHGAGAPAGGRFARRVNLAPADGLTRGRRRGEVLTAARAAGRIGSSVPVGAPQHIDDIRAVL